MPGYGGDLLGGIGRKVEFVVDEGRVRLVLRSQPEESGVRAGTEGNDLFREGGG